MKPRPYTVLLTYPDQSRSYPAKYHKELEAVEAAGAAIDSKTAKIAEVWEHTGHGLILLAVYYRTH